MRVDYRILGSLEALRDGEPLELGGAKQRAVLALLLVNANRLVTTDALTEALWSGKPPAKPLTSIQGYVSHLRKALTPERGSDAIITEPAGYRLAVDPGDTDLGRFEALARSARTALGEDRPADASTALTEALALFRGAPLADFAYEDWARVQIDRIEELRLACLEDRIDADLALGRHAEVVGELEALIVQHQLRERFRGQLMLALYRSGRQAEALDLYQATRTALVEELGLEPGPEIQTLHGQILNQDPVLAAPERQAPAQRLVRLPTAASSFIGREVELAEVIALIERDDVRLVTLTGPGGTGKTRLAREAAAVVSARFPDGIFWASLAPLREPALVPAAIAEALEVQEQPGVPLRETIVRTCAGKRALVLVDNCEHLVEAAAEIAQMLIEDCPQLVVVATSRERLGLRGERTYSVPPMALQEGEALFAERARAAEARFESDEHVAAICQALDGLPLAIELAAARVRSVSTHAIRKRLTDRMPLLTSRDRGVEERQRTLEATIGWSYDLLDSEEQRAFRALSVFAGGSTLDAAEQVAGADLDLLESLLDKSLIRHSIDRAGQDRYWMLETIREYAARELGEDAGAGERAHSVWVLGVVRMAPRWSEPAQQTRLDLTLAESGNIRLALSRAIDRRDADEALELVGLIGRTWLEAGRAVELGARAGEALELGGGEAGLQGLALISLSVSCKPTAAIEVLEQAGPLLRTASMPREAAYAAMVQGMHEGEAGSVGRAIELCEEALAEFGRLGDDYCAAITQYNIDYVRGLRWPLNPEEARVLVQRYRDAVSDSRRRGDRGDEIAMLDCLGHALVDAGEVDEAWRTALGAVALMEAFQAGYHSLGSVIAALARAAGLRGEPEQALVLVGSLRSAMNDLGSRLAVPRRAAVDAIETSCREALDEEKAAGAIADGEAMSVESLLEYVATLKPD